MNISKGIGLHQQIQHETDEWVDSRH